LRLFSFGDYGLALVVFGAYDGYSVVFTENAVNESKRMQPVKIESDLVFVDARSRPNRRIGLRVEEEGNGALNRAGVAPWSPRRCAAAVAAMSPLLT